METEPDSETYNSHTKKKTIDQDRGTEACFNIPLTKMDLEEVGWEVVDWMHLDEVRDCWRAVVNTVMNVRFH
jgi:hypothetical protein